MTSVCPRGHASRDPEYCDRCGRRIKSRSEAARTQPSVSPSSRTWIAIASADRAYFDAVAPANALFPVHYKSRNYALAEGEVLIGRHSSSRGIAPQIDLSGPQEDMGISHRHVWLERQAEGGYALVDAGSTNGTTINDSPVKVAPHARVPLVDGDRIHIGHWTTLTLRELGRQPVDTGIWAEEERPRTSTESPEESEIASSASVASFVTWLVSTNIEGSSRIKNQSAERYADLIDRYQDLAAEVCGNHGGTVLGTVDDSAVMALPTASAAFDLALAMVAANPSLARDPRPAPLIRIGIDAQVSEEWESRFIPAIRQTTLAVCLAANGGQVLVSEAAMEAGFASDLPSDADLEDLGEHRLASLARPYRLYQLVHPDLSHDFPPLRVLDNRPNNLPEQVTDFVGRQNDIADVVNTLRSSRLCTITGPAGVGKTRLAMQVGARMLDRFPDGVWLADLAAEANPAQVPRTVADALAVFESGAGTVASPDRAEPRTVLANLITHLADADSLLILNNCEHVLEAAAELVRDLLRNCATLRILVTSRESLRLLGEAVYRLEPLRLPNRWESQGSLRDADAVALFLNRAVMHRTDLAFDDATLHSAVHICQRMDGIPLAIEIAAARTKDLGIDQIAEMLDEKLPPAAGRRMSSENLHSTLHSAIEWSYNLLSDRERMLFPRLAVFANGFDLNACRVVCGGAGLERFEVAGLLTALVEKSLVETEVGGTGSRCRMLETTRRYAEDQLATADVGELIQDNHLAYYLDIAERAEAELYGPDCDRWMQVLETERENLLAAMEMGRTGHARDDLRIAAALGHYWVIRGQLTEGSAILDEALERYRDHKDPLRAKALCERAALACFGGDTERGGQAAAEALTLANVHDIRGSKAYALTLLGIVELAHGDREKAERLHAEAIDVCADVPDQSLMGFIVANHGNALLALGETRRARQQYDESVRLRRAKADGWGLAWALYRSGALATWEGRFPEAISELDEALEHARKIRYEQGVLLALLGAAEAFYVNADQVAAEEKYRQALDLARELEEPTSACLAVAGLAAVSLASGDLVRAGMWLTEEEAIQADRTAKTLATVKSIRAALASARGDDATAETLHREVLLLREQVGDQLGMTDQLERLALNASRRGQLEHAAILMAAAAGRRDEMGLPVPVIRKSAVDSLVARVAESTTDRVHAAWADGMLTSFDDVVSMAIAEVGQLTSTVREAPPAVVGDSYELSIRSDAWATSLREGLVGVVGEATTQSLMSRYASAFPPEYWLTRSAEAAIADIQLIENRGGRIGARLDRSDDGAGGFLRLKIVDATDIALADVLPILDNAGLRVLDEHPYRVRLADAEPVWLHDLRLTCVDSAAASADRDTYQRFEDLFIAVWDGVVENDRFNQLVLGAGVSKRDVTILRAYARYLRLIGNAFSQEHIQRTLAAHPTIAAALISMFRCRFDPAGRQSSDAEAAAIEAELRTDIDAVTSLDEDRILRSILNLIHATVRTNFFQATGDGAKPTVSFKLDPELVTNLPLPRPMFEVFVYSPRVEGVHLRGGRVARGGIRWSDRLDDFRAEILGLMKAQMVKNAVIVPVGAKGGFIVRRPPSDAAERNAEGRACYRAFIEAILDITDNVVNGAVVPPPDVVRYDGDDPYLVVAADKGTATFADLGNTISAEYGFWLSDAFAAGGSNGYDHKKLGITARGAWESTKRHFRQMASDATSAPITVAGIGDMSGDVFGNGLLLSHQLRLVAAFDHRHVFIDPDPDPDTSYQERLRLSQLERSSWADYATDALSAGGGIYSRQLKAIRLSPETRQMLALVGDDFTPDDIVRAILTAPVDLLYNGGIGTYVRSSEESNIDVGDKTNDATRVSADQLRCRVVVEGGNLGITQRGRVEYAVHGGLINTDAIDNSAGVDCSDHEVNIKILLSGLESAGELSRAERDALLAEMADDVTGLVLRDNYQQALALARNAAIAAEYGQVHLRYIQSLESNGHINRPLESLPTDKQFAERLIARQGLCRPELAVIFAHTKMVGYDDLVASTVPDDPYFEARLDEYFPPKLRARFAGAISGHPLRREIIATSIINELVNRQEVSFLFRLQDETEASIPDIVCAYIASVDLLHARSCWAALDGLDGTLAEPERFVLLRRQNNHIEAATRWLLRHPTRSPEPGSMVERFRAPLNAIFATLPDVLADSDREWYAEDTRQMTAAGVPEAVACRLALCDLVSAPLDIADITFASGESLGSAISLYFDVRSALQLDWLQKRVLELPDSTLMELLARISLRDGLDRLHREIAKAVLAEPGGANGDSRVQQWLTRNATALKRSSRLVSEMRDRNTADAAAIGLVLTEMRELV